MVSVTYFFAKKCDEKRLSVINFFAMTWFWLSSRNAIKIIEILNQNDGYALGASLEQKAYITIAMITYRVIIIKMQSILLIRMRIKSLQRIRLLTKMKGNCVSQKGFFFKVCSSQFFFSFWTTDLDGNGYWDENEVKALFQKELDKMYDPNAPEDDLMERYEEMERMRQHVFKESDTDQNNLIR